MTAQLQMCPPARPADVVLRDKLERVRRALADDGDIEPATHARLTHEAARLERILAQKRNIEHRQTK